MRRLALAPLLAVALLLCGVGLRVAQAADAITAIEIKGNRSIDAETVRSRLQLTIGGAYDPAKADQSVKALFATGVYSDVRIERRGSTIIVHLVENPIVTAVSVEGNSAIDKAKIEAVIRLKPRQAYTVSRARAEAVRIRDLYRRQGRLGTTVEAKTNPQGEGRVEVVFVVREGEVTKVDNISFVGNRHYSERQLRDVISTSQSSWLDILKSAAFYDPERIESDRELLRRHYLKTGFPDVRVSAGEAVKNAQGTGYAVSFTVEEGERFTFGAASISSKLAGIEAGGLQSALAITPGNVFNQETVEKSVERIALALADQGQVAVRVRPVPKRDSARRTIDVAFLVEPGPRILVERIDIVGNKKTKDFVIRREFQVGEGAPVNAVMIERGRKRVQALGFFKSVAVQNRTGSAPDQAVITITVVEQESNDLSFGVGYSMQEGVIGDISLTERNFLGNGQWLRLKLEGSLTRLQAEVGFTEPRFLGTNLAAGFDLFYRDVDYTKQASYMSQKIGGTLRARYPINEEWSAGVNYTFVRNKLYDVGANASAAIKEAVPGFPDATSSTYYTSSVGYSLTYDTRDNKKRPTSGVYYTVAQDLAGVGGDVQFLRSVGEARAYYAVSENVTAMARATGGIITGWGGQDVRLLDLFYRGGETVRGFATAGIGPRDTQSVNQDALGGRIYYGTSAELLFAIPGVPEDIGLRGAVFADAGSLWSTSSTAAALPGVAGNTPALRASVGVGLAWDSPLGNLRVDYAFPVLKESYDKTQALSFGLRPF
ncbi:MAG TPA: outer membrane protein assembly factor BamA [Hyphomicrobiaceae bacterium]